MAERPSTMVTTGQIEGALRGRIGGDLLTDRFSLAVYGTAACIYRILPLAVVVPRDASDVVTAVRTAAQLGVPVIPRGAGSGLCGQALGRGIVLDFTKYMAGILDMDPERRLIRVQPGIVMGHVNEALAPHALMLGPDPSSEPFCTIGGNLGNNASGARGIRYGSMREHVAYLDVVLADGSRVRLEPVAAEGEAYARLASRGDLVGRIVSGTRRIVTEHAELILRHQPFTTKNSAGYNVFDLLCGGVFDLTRLVVGCEGTLAVIVEAGLRLVHKPSERASLLLWFSGLEKAGEAVHPILDLGPSACEIMERHFLDVVRADGSVPREYLPEEADTVLLVEQISDSRSENEAFIARVRERVIDRLGLAFDGIDAYDPLEQVRLWQVRKRAVQILQGLPGPKRVTPFIEDVSVPPERLVEYIRGIREIFDRFGVKAAVYGHAGDSNLHARPLLDTRVPEDVAKMKGIAGAVAQLVVDIGGTVSCEHGDGLTRSGYLELQFGSELYAVMGQVKRLWDPQNVLNPGKVITDEREIHLGDLRMGPGFTQRPTGEAFDREPWAEELVRCHGCGTCRGACPVYKVTGDEVAAPRGKAALLREWISGGLDLEDLDAAKMREVAGLCYNCKMCLVECPSNVDVPGLVLRHKEHLAAKGHLGLAERMLTKVRPMGRAGSMTAPVSNWLARLGPVRFLMEKLAGVGRTAALPRFGRGPLKEGVGTGPAEPARRIAYFAGCFELFNEQQIGRAALKVLDALGCEVFIPRQRCCGIPKISAGDAKGAVKDMRFNLDVLAPLVEAGYTVVSGCPSCVLTLTDDYPDMATDDARARLVAEHTRDVHDLLDDLVEAQQAEVSPFSRDPQGSAPLLAYHAPCHLRAAGRGGQPRRLLERLLGLEFVVSNETCCGMGGTYGLKSKNASISGEIAQPVFDTIRGSGAEAVVTSCGMCRTQLAHGTGLPVYHPMELLADALAPAAAVAGP